ncbi:MAG TPA: mechanosensitive ion channel domain-containing protein [Xanthobacteraceae bacterium]|jgi:small-conductance mechanosensitive channel
MNGLQDFFRSWRDWLDWAPEWSIALVALTAAVLIALLAHRTAVHVARRLFVGRPLLRSLFRRLEGPSLLALVIVAVGVTLSGLPIEPMYGDLLRRLLILCFFILVGWMLLTASNMAADVYLTRLHLDVEDNLLARKQLTQFRVLKGTLDFIIVLVTAGAVLMTFEPVRQYGVSLFASAGIAGIVVGFAARPVLSNLLAGLQIALTQPIRIDDAVVVENEWGRIEEITSAYVVVRLWDLRRLIVPLTYFIEKPFQNWTRESASIIGSVFIYADYSVPVAKLRERLKELVRESPLWDGRVVDLKVTDAKERTVELRATMSARTSSAAWDLRCEIREKLIDYLQREFPHALPRERAEIESGAGHGSQTSIEASPRRANA